MKHFPLLFCIFLAGGLFAQHGTTFHFRFTLHDPELELLSDRDILKARVSRDGRTLTIKTEQARYRLQSELRNAFSINEGEITLSYFTLSSPFGWIQFDIYRLNRQRKEARWHIRLEHLQDHDFSRLSWQTDSLVMDLNYDRDLMDYRILVPLTEEGHRDLTHLLAGHAPKWELTDAGNEKQKLRTLRKFQAIKQRLENAIDSLIAAHFPTEAFLQQFQLAITSAHYDGFVFKNEPFRVDTSLYEINHLYVYHSPDFDYELPIYVRSSIHDGTFFANIDFGEKFFSTAEMNFLPPVDIGAYALQQFPDTKFIDFTGSSPGVVLVYLPCPPQDTPPSDYRAQPEPSPGSEPHVTTAPPHTPCVGTFAYQLQSPLPAIGNYMGYTNYYFFAHRATLYAKTTNYYNSLDE